jgi:putative endonuclease
MTATYAQRKALGDFGERAAARFLLDRGMTVLDRNWRCDQGELDIVAYDGTDLVVCEVKTRTSGRYGTPFEAVTEDKAFRLRRLGWRWATTHPKAPRYDRLRVDVLAVTAGPRGAAEIEHVVGLA